MMIKSRHNYAEIREIKLLNDLAVENYKNHNVKEALNACRRIYELEPAPDILKQSINLGINHMRYHLILGEIYYKKGNYADALKILNSLKPLGKHFSDKYIILAKIYLKDKDYTGALREYEEMTTECPQRFESILNGLLDVINRDPFIDRSYELLHDLYIKRGKKDSLIPEFKRRAREDVHNRQSLLSILEHLYYIQGQTAQALPLLIQHQDRYPEDAKSFYLLGKIYLESGKYTEAIMQFNQVIRLDPSRKTDIITSIEKISDKKDTDNTIVKYLLNLCIDEGKPVQAERILDHLLETEPDSVEYRDMMERVLVRLIEDSLPENNPDFCKSKIEKLIRLRPEDTGYKEKLRDIQDLVVRRKILDYEERLKSIDVHEDEANKISFDLAMLYINSGKSEERAISLLQKVAKSDHSKKAEALLQVGLNLLAKGYNDAAYDNFNEILILYLPDREKLQYLYRIAVACEEKNLLNKAEYFFGKILSMDMQYRDATKRLKRISALTSSAISKALITNMNQKFENIEKIGEGNIWVYYKAADKLLKRKVVIMTIKEDFRYDPETIDHFIRETQRLSRSQHTGIVKIYDVNIDILLYIVMEHIDGESLRVLQKRKPFYWKDVLKIAIDTCDAIKCAHKHGVIHRDIRPDNIRLTKDNTVKISGFGLAHITGLSDADESNQITEIPLYKSPEQIRGERIDERSDIYSLGITLYEILTGHPPFQEGDIAHHQINEQPGSLSKENPEIPGWLDKIVLKCLSKNPSDRYQETGHLQKMLESYSRLYID